MKGRQEGTQIHTTQAGLQEKLFYGYDSSVDIDVGEEETDIAAWRVKKEQKERKKENQEEKEVETRDDGETPTANKRLSHWQERKAKRETGHTRKEEDKKYIPCTEDESWVLSPKPTDHSLLGVEREREEHNHNVRLYESRMTLLSALPSKKKESKDT